MTSNAIFTILANNNLIGIADSKEEARLIANAHNILASVRGPFARIIVRD
jgi:hypothetical protein